MLALPCSLSEFAHRCEEPSGPVHGIAIGRPRGLQQKIRLQRLAPHESDEELQEALQLLILVRPHVSRAVALESHRTAQQATLHPKLGFRPHLQANYKT